MDSVLTQYRYQDGKIKPVIDRVIPMKDLKAAYERMGSRRYSVLTTSRKFIPSITLCSLQSTYSVLTPYISCPLHSKYSVI